MTDSRLKSAARADECRAQALSAARAAEASTLAHIREKHELSAAAWLELARAEDRRTVKAEELTSAAAQRLR